MLTGILKSAEEITGIKGCTNFSGYLNGLYFYREDFVKWAGKRLQIERTEQAPYDYIIICGSSFYVQKEWLKDIQEEVDWSKVPMDAPIIVTEIDGIDYHRHFAGLRYGKISTWINGKTSWTATREGFIFLNDCKVRLKEAK